MIKIFVQEVLDDDHSSSNLHVLLTSAQLSHREANP